MIKYVPIESNHKDCCKVEKRGNLILTGWGYAEYVASAAVALKTTPMSVLSSAGPFAP